MELIAVDNSCVFSLQEVANLSGATKKQVLFRTLMLLKHGALRHRHYALYRKPTKYELKRDELEQPLRRLLPKAPPALTQIMLIRLRDEDRAVKLVKSTPPTDLFVSRESLDLYIQVNCEPETIEFEIQSPKEARKTIENFNRQVSDLFRKPPHLPPVAEVLAEKTSTTRTQVGASKKAPRSSRPVRRTRSEKEINLGKVKSGMLALKAKLSRARYQALFAKDGRPIRTNIVTELEAFGPDFGLEGRGFKRRNIEKNVSQILQSTPSLLTRP